MNTKDPLKKYRFNPAKSSHWRWFMRETLKLDKGNLHFNKQPDGWHWFWGLYYLQSYIPSFDLKKITTLLPDEHWLNIDEKEAYETHPISGDGLHYIEPTNRRTHSPIKIWLKKLNIIEIATELNFSDQSFNNIISFSNFIFPVDVNFSNTTFLKDAYFTNTIFLNTASFENAEFHGETANFRSTIFEKEADFNKTIFKHYANFKGAKFGDRTIFQQAKFDFHAPRFYGAEFNNELILNRIELPKATKDTLLKVKKTEAKKGDTKNDIYQKTIEENKSAYETLIYLMEKQNKHHDKQRFFREEMRWRQLGNKITRERLIADAPMKTRGCYLFCRRLKRMQFKKFPIENTVARKQRKNDSLKRKYSNYPKSQRIENNFIIAFFSVYDNVADYGNGIGRAFTWWLGHIAFGIGALIIMVFFSLLWECWQGKWEFTKDILCSIPVSFSNANPVAFIDFKDGGLMYCHDKLKGLSPFNFGMIKAIQIIVGIPLLFILLTTLRVRFRLGGATSNNKG